MILIFVESKKIASHGPGCSGELWLTSALDSCNAECTVVRRRKIISIPMRILDDINVQFTV
jgi:hypothetical protein